LFQHPILLRRQVHVLTAPAPRPDAVVEPGEGSIIWVAGKWYCWAHSGVGFLKCRRDSRTKCCSPLQRNLETGTFFLPSRLTRPGPIRQNHAKVLTGPAPPPSSRSLALVLTHAEFGGHSYASHKPGSLLRTLPTRGSTGKAFISPAS
jgi:hypothetical protein